jgi:hypothetical protein
MTRFLAASEKERDPRSNVLFVCRPHVGPLLGPGFGMDRKYQYPLLAENLMFVAMLPLYGS